MTTSNWIEVGIIVLIIIVGTSIYLYSKKKVEDLESTLEIRKREDIPGQVDDEDERQD